MCVRVPVASGFYLFHRRRHQTPGQNAWLLISMATETVGSEPSKRLCFLSPLSPATTCQHTSLLPDLRLFIAVNKVLYQPAAGQPQTLHPPAHGGR